MSVPVRLMLCFLTCRIPGELPASPAAQTTPMQTAVVTPGTLLFTVQLCHDHFPAQHSAVSLHQVSRRPPLLCTRAMRRLQNPIAAAQSLKGSPMLATPDATCTSAHERSPGSAQHACWFIDKLQPHWNTPLVQGRGGCGRLKLQRMPSQHKEESRDPPASTRYQLENHASRLP